MTKMRRSAAFCIGIGVSLFMTACGGGGSSNPPPPPTTYTLTVSSTNPASGVAITVSPADANGSASGSTSFSRTYDAGASVTLTAPATSGGNNLSWSGCTSASTVTCTVAMNGDMAVTANYATSTTTPTVTVTPSASSITAAQPLTVTVALSGSPAPTGTVVLTSGSYTSASTTLSSGGASINIPAGSLATATDTLTVSYTPDTASASTYNSSTGTSSVTVTALVLITPTVTVTPSASSITAAQPLTVTVALSGSPAPTGTVVLTSGSYTSASTTLSSGGASINIPAGSLATATDTLTVSYTPDTASAATYNSSSGTSSVKVTATTLITPTVTVTPSASSITTAQPLTVTVALSGSPAPTGTVVLTSGSYTSASTTLSSGGASINIPAGSLATATDTLTVSYTPDTAGAVTYNSSTGTSSVIVTASALIAPTVTVTPASFTITTTQSLNVTVAVSGGSGKLIPTGFVKLTSGSYSSAATTLSGGTAQINIPAGSLATGSDTLSVTYTPDSTSSSTYKTSTGTSAAVTVSAATTVTVNLSSDIGKATDQILGMNLAMWYDVSSTTNAPNIEAGFTAAGIKAVRWPGGSNSDRYNWETNNECSGYAVPTDDFTDFIDNLVRPAGYDLAITADYGTGKNCTGAGDPTEAAAWAAEAVTLGLPVHYMTVGNEEFGSWEFDNHTKKHDGPTYAAAVGLSTGSGYYADIKAASPTTLVGVDADPNYAPWDQDVLSGASYDFIEYHYYAFNPGGESDATLVNSAAQTLSAKIKAIRTEMTNWGTNKTAPIYVGEIGSVSSNPGKQSWSITQGLYAGQVLGEAMNDGVARLTWWIGFGNCNTGTGQNDSSSLYGWQDFGAYNIFSDGPSDTDCPGAGPLGTMSPTAQAFSLFQNVAVTGETVLTATAGGDTADIVAYAATHSGGTALVVFNRNETTSEPVVITLSGQSSSTGVTQIYYDKAIYDLSGSPTGTFPDPAGTSTWAGPKTIPLGAQALPLSVTLTPWSMNVFIIK